MKQIRMLKPYGQPKEGEMITSIVAYKKIPWVMSDNTVVQHRYWLHINLWFVVLEFGWYSKLAPTTTDKQ